MCITDSGRLFEATLLGSVGNRALCDGSYKPWRECMGLVQGCQPRQMRPTAARLLTEVRRLVGRLTAVDFYTAVGSTLDLRHSVDGFFHIPACGLVVTIDVTLNPNKVYGKADLILHDEDFENLPALATRIARLFADKAKERRQEKYLAAA